MKKKFIVGLLTTVLAFGVLTGCGVGSSTSDQAADTSQE